MKGDRHTRQARGLGAAILPPFALALALASAAEAQDAGSVQDFQLKPGAPAPTPTAAGPVDAEDPAARPARPVSLPAPRPAPTSGAAPSPTIVLPAPAVRPSPSPAARAGGRVAPSARPSAEATTDTTTAPIPAPTEPPDAQATASSTLPAAPPSEPTPIVSSAATGPAGESPIWPWIASAAVLAILAGLLVRRRAGETEYEHPAEEPQAALDPVSPPAVLPRPVSQPAGAPHLPTPPSPEPVQPALARSASQPGPIDETLANAEAGPLGIVLEPRHLSRAMVNASLAYRLALSNRGDTPMGPLHIAGDIITAHASLSAHDQLLPADEALAVIHEVPALSPGETATVSGELRLPIASIMSIQSGATRVFVPLARFRVADGSTIATRVFVVGQASDRPGGGLKPFLLDRGPGVDRALDHRELVVTQA